MTAGSRVRARFTCCGERVAIARQRVVADECTVGDRARRMSSCSRSSGTAARSCDADRRPCGAFSSVPRARRRARVAMSRMTPWRVAASAAVARIEQRQRDAVLLVAERRIARQPLAVAAHRQRLGQLAEVPSPQIPCARTPVPRRRTTAGPPRAGSPARRPGRDPSRAPLPRRR